MRIHDLNDLHLDSALFLRNLPPDSLLAQRNSSLVKAFQAWFDNSTDDTAAPVGDFMSPAQFQDIQSILHLSTVARVLAWVERQVQVPLSTLRVAIETPGQEEGRWFDPKVYGLPGVKSLEIRKRSDATYHAAGPDPFLKSMSLASRPAPRIRTVSLRDYLDPRHIDLYWTQPALVIAVARAAPERLAETLSKSVLILHGHHPAGDAEAVAWMLERLGLELHELNLRPREAVENVLLALPTPGLTAQAVVSAREEVEQAFSDLLFPLGELRHPSHLVGPSPAEWTYRPFVDGSVLDEQGVYRTPDGTEVALVDDAEEMQTLSGRLGAIRAALHYREQHPTRAPLLKPRVRPFDFNSEVARKALRPPALGALRSSAPPAYCDADGRTPMHYLAHSDDPARVSPFWKASGMDINARDCDGRTPLELALWKGSTRMVALLTDARASEEGTTCCGRSLAALTEAWFRRSQGELDRMKELYKGRIPSLREERFAPLAGSPTLSMPLVEETNLVYEPIRPRERARTIPLFAWAALLPLARRDAALAAIQEWAQKRGSLQISDLMASEVHGEGAAFQSSADTHSGLWAARFTKHAAEGESYRTEFVAFPSDAHLCVGVRLVYHSEPGVTPDPNPSIPAIVGRLAAFDARDAGLSLGAPVPARTGSEGEALARVLVSPARNTSILLVASDARGAAERAVPSRLIGPCAVVFADQDALEGLRAALPPEAKLPEEGSWRLYPPHYGALLELGQDPSYSIEAVLGVPESVLSKRLVTHLCRFSAEDAEAFEVPTYVQLRKQIAQRASQRAAQARAQAKETARAAAASSESPEARPTAEEAEALAARDVEAPAQPAAEAQEPAVEERARELLAEAQRAVMEDLQLRVLELEEELAQARDEIRELKEEVEYGEEELQEKLSELAQAQEANARLRAKLSQLTAAGPATEEAPAAYPDSFDDLEDWALERFPDTLLLASKAVRSARAAHVDADVIQQAYQSLELLATDYLHARAGVAGAQDRVVARMKELRIDCSPVGIAAEHRQYRDAYRAQVEGKFYLTDLHVSGSSSRDPKRCLRIYFHFDEARGRIIVGHLPTHLDNTLT